MINKCFSRAVAVLLLQPAITCATETIDPTEVAPGNYQVILENEHVRVVRFQIEPGQRDTWHTHPPKLSVTTQSGRLRITLGNGESFEVDEKAGTATWMNALGRHFGENIGNTPVEIIYTEVKSAAAR